MTLVELLVVITIMTLLMAVTLPRLRPMMENRNVRESARAVSVFLIQARTRAMETGRPCGVLFERANDRNQPNACVTLRQVEVPGAYGGDVAGAAVIVQDWTYNPNTGNLYWPGYIVLKVAIRTDAQWSDGLVRRGDVIQLGYQGATYEIIDDPYETPESDFPIDANGFIRFSVAANTSPPADYWADNCVLTLRRPIEPGAAVPWSRVPVSGDYPGIRVRETVTANPPRWSAPVPFKIFRQPSAASDVAFASVAPSLQLFRQAAIDLRWSGTGDIGDDPLDTIPPPDTRQVDNFRAELSGTNPITVMFSPNGSIDHVTYGGTPNRVTSPVFLLIGRMDRVDVDLLPDDEFNNYEDLNNLWLAINPQTGLITTSEPAADAANVNASRELARQTQISMGGR